MRLGQRVKVNGGLKEFHGQTGVVVGHESDGQMVLNRVRLDNEVMVEGVGLVTDDLWSNEWLTKTKESK